MSTTQSIAQPMPPLPPNHPMRLVIQTDEPGRLNEVVVASMEAIATAEGIPLSGLTLMGGRPYVNSTGLDVKLDNVCQKNGWVKAKVTVEFIKGSEPSSDDPGYRCGFVGTIELFDKAGFMEALKTLAEKMPPEKLNPDFIKELKTMFTYVYSDEGWCGMASEKMSTMRNKDFLRMKGSRRASNRAKRAATGIGLTSVDEMDIDGPPLVKPEGRIEHEVVQQPVPQQQAQPPAAAPRKLVFIDWQDKEGRTALVHGFVVVDEFRSRMADFAKWDQTKKHYVVEGAYVSDVQELCERLGYETEYSTLKQPIRTVDAEPVPERVYEDLKPMAPPPAQIPPPQDIELKLVEEVRGPKTASNSKKYLEVLYGGTWYGCWEEPMFDLLKEAKGKMAAFKVVPDQRFPKIKGFIQIENRFFEADGITAIIQIDEPRGGKLF